METIFVDAGRQYVYLIGTGGISLSRGTLLVLFVFVERLCADKSKFPFQVLSKLSP